METAIRLVPVTPLPQSSTPLSKEGFHLPEKIQPAREGVGAERDRGREGGGGSLPAGFNTPSWDEEEEGWGAVNRGQTTEHVKSENEKNVRTPTI